MKELAKSLDLDLPLKATKIDVPYWPVKQEFSGKYHISRFPPGIYDFTDETGHNVHFYWTPEKEYPGMMKIAISQGQERGL